MKGRWYLAAALCVVAATVCGSHAQMPRTPRSTVPAVLLSDIHLDPFYDPVKVQQLASAPAEKWEAVLSGPDSSTQEHDFRALEDVCKQKSDDTSPQLWRSSLKAMHRQGLGAAFVVVSGDLLAHNFDCKFKKSFPTASDADYVSFVAQTVRYEVRGLQLAFPATPLYIAMGNNDSGCGDYRDERSSAFLEQTARTMAQALSPNDRPDELREFSREGFYSAALPPAIRNGRILVLDDLFLSRRHTDCAGKQDEAADEAVIQWLRTQLADARERKQQVWVVGHIPPGIDLYATLRGLENVCKTAPQMFLANEKLASVLTSYPDVVRLAVFGHTHTDEMRLLTHEFTGREDAVERPGPGVAMKVVASISPVNGNLPSFTVARVDRKTADLVDYTVVAASNASGVGTTWRKEYSYAEVYHQPAFTPSALKTITDGFRADRLAMTPESRTYLQDLFIGDRSALLRPFWPEYVCALTHDSAEIYSKCVCSK